MNPGVTGTGRATALQERVAAAIYRAIDDVNPQLPAGSRLQKRRETVLFGREEGLDSLGLVNLMVAIEKHLEKTFGKAVSLSVADMIAEPETPFADVRSLEHYVVSRLETAATRE